MARPGLLILALGHVRSHEAALPGPAGPTGPPTHLPFPLHGPAGPPTTPAPSRLARALILGYAVAVYVFFVALLVYSVGFFIGFGVPKGIDEVPISPGRSRWASTPRCCCCSRSSTR